MKEIIAIQHTQSVHHTNGMIGSWTDWALTESGKEQAEKIGARLSAEIKDRSWKIYASDLIRTRQTAEPLARYLGEPVEYRAELREINSGAAVGKSGQWMRENSAPVHTIDDRPFPDAESCRDVWNRLSAFCEAITRSADEHIVIVSHGWCLPVFYGVWLKWHVETLETSGFKGHAGGVSFLNETPDGKRVITRINDLSYIR